MQAENKGVKAKQVYEKPQLKIIELTAEEVLGLNCFNTNEFFGNPDCLNPSPPCSNP